MKCQPSNPVDKKYKTIFVGTPEFAVPILEKLQKADFCSLKAVVTQPDKPAGRKQELKFSAVKITALRRRLPVIQPKSARNNAFINQIRKLNPNLIVVAAYGEILPKEILTIPEFGCLNIHASLLPKYRGASPIQYAVLEGEKETGVTIILMDEKMDHGPILAQEKIKITNTETNETLRDKLAILGAQLLIKTLPNYLEGKIKLRPQDKSKVTFTKIIKREDGKISWQKKASEIERQIRAFYPWPGAWTMFLNRRLKILEAETLDKKVKDKNIGQVYLDENKKMAIKCGQGSLIVKKLQLAGKKIISGQEFLRGYPEITENCL